MVSLYETFSNFLFLHLRKPNEHAKEEFIQKTVWSEHIVIVSSTKGSLVMIDVSG